MAEPESVVQLPERTIPTVTLDLAGSRFTPNDLRALKAETGKNLAALTGPDADDGDRMQTMAWLRLRREGRSIPWDALGDVEIDVTQPEPPDPTSAGR